MLKSNILKFFTYLDLFALLEIIRYFFRNVEYVIIHVMLFHDHSRDYLTDVKIKTLQLKCIFLFLIAIYLYISICMCVDIHICTWQTETEREQKRMCTHVGTVPHTVKLFTIANPSLIYYSESQSVEIFCLLLQKFKTAIHSL